MLIGSMIERFNAGQRGGVGIKRERERVRLVFEDSMTCRDLDDVTFLDAEPPTLLDLMETV